MDNRVLIMELDTDASVSIISEKTWREVLQRPPFSSSPVKLRMYTRKLGAEHGV